MTRLANTAARRRERRRRWVVWCGMAAAHVAVVGAAFGVGLWIAPALGDDRKCAAVRDLPGAAIVNPLSTGEADVIVVAPWAGALRWCYFNSPFSGRVSTHRLTVAGEEIGFHVRITPGPEYLTFDLPGAIATDIDGVPLREIAVPDGEEREGLLWRGMS